MFIRQEVAEVAQAPVEETSVPLLEVQPSVESNDTSFQVQPLKA